MCTAAELGRSVADMAVHLEKLFARQVDIGIATVDMPAEDGAISARVVVQEVAAVDQNTGEERRLLLVYEPKGVIAMADVLRQAAEKATSEST
jgi:chemotaxis protein CheY-P-specific phosphatase CheC